MVKFFYIFLVKQVHGIRSVYDNWDEFEAGWVKVGWVILSFFNRTTLTLELKRRERKK